MKVSFILLILLMEILVALPLIARERNTKNIRNPPKYSLKLMGKLRRRLNLPKKYARKDFDEY